MRCELAEKMIARSVDNELAVKEVGALRRHLTGCAACATLAEEARDLKGWFVADDPVEIPSGFAQRVTSKAFAQAGEERPSFQRLPGKAPEDVPALPGGGLVQGAFGSSAFGAGSKDRFLVGLTALAAALLVALGMALYMQRASESKNLIADDRTLHEMLDSLNDANRMESAPEQTPSTGKTGGADGE